jgi:hypothetical protein
MTDVDIAVEKIRGAMEEGPEAWVTAVESLVANSLRVRHDPPIEDWGSTEEVEGSVDSARMCTVWREEILAFRRAAPDYHVSHIDVRATPQGGVYFANHHTGTLKDGRVVSAPVSITTEPLENGKIVSWTVTTYEDAVPQLRDWLAAGEMQVPHV